LHIGGQIGGDNKSRRPCRSENDIAIKTYRTNSHAKAQRRKKYAKQAFLVLHQSNEVCVIKGKRGRMEKGKILKLFDLKTNNHFFFPFFPFPIFPSYTNHYFSFEFDFLHLAE
jgi:hypothetical protein